MPKDPRIFSTRCEGVNGFLITPSLRIDGKTASNSRFVYFKHCHHHDFHFRSQILYSSDELKARQCRHPDIRYQDCGVFCNCHEYVVML